LESAGVEPGEIELLVLGTTTPDLIFPATACLLQHRLGANGCAAFDVNAACSGFIYALSVADKFIRSGTVKTALVVGAETLSRMVDWSDRATCVLFGDGAGAVVLKASDEPGILSTHLHADGGHKEWLGTARTRLRGALGQDPARPDAAARSLRRRFHLGFGADQILKRLILGSTPSDLPRPSK
jgi:3-oxoacyl-(acyl-carrier-protein) synthase III